MSYALPLILSAFYLAMVLLAAQILISERVTSRAAVVALAIIWPAVLAVAASIGLMCYIGVAAVCLFRFLRPTTDEGPVAP